MADDFLIFTGTANPRLAESIATHLGLRLGARSINRFPDGEVFVRIEEPVRRKEIFIVQPTSPPVNDNLMELLIFADACRRASAARVTAIIPYFGYARSDKRHGHRESITASMAADLLQAVGVNQVVTVDLHAPQIEGYFHTPVDSLTAVPTLCAALKERIPQDAVVVSPDAGRVSMATEYAHRLDTSVIVLHKQRESGTATRITHVVGDVRNRACLIVDDMISTGGTIAESVEALISAGARREIMVAATHGLLIGDAFRKLGHEAVRQVYITDTISTEHRREPLLNVISVAPVIASAIRRIMADGSLSDLF